MSVRENTNETVPTTTKYRTASYMPCEDCGEGALVWDENARTSKCNCCGTLHSRKE